MCAPLFLLFIGWTWRERTFFCFASLSFLIVFGRSLFHIHYNGGAFLNTAKYLRACAVRNARLHTVCFKRMTVAYPQFVRALAIYYFVLYPNSFLGWRKAQSLSGHTNNAVLLKGVDGNVGGKTGFKWSGLGADITTS